MKLTYFYITIKLMFINSSVVQTHELYTVHEPQLITVYTCGIAMVPLYWYENEVGSYIIKSIIVNTEYIKGFFHNPFTQEVIFYVPYFKSLEHSCIIIEAVKLFEDLKVKGVTYIINKAYYGIPITMELLKIQQDLGKIRTGTLLEEYRLFVFYELNNRIGLLAGVEYDETGFNILLDMDQLSIIYS
jgi:hypothetical protein